MIAAVIPTRYRPPELAPLVEQLLADGVQPIVLESADYDHRIYRMWNAGVEKARIIGAGEVAILNDDVTLLPGSLPLMAQALRSDPFAAVVYPDVNAAWSLPATWSLEATRGTWGAGGMTGFCFMFRTALRQPFDEAYHWWYGDDAFEDEVRRTGLRVCRVVGLPIRHVGNGSASKRWAELAPLIEQDRARWDAHTARWAGVLAHYARDERAE